MKSIFMWLYGPLETDARVLRSIEAVLNKNYQLTIVTCNTSSDFESKDKYIIKNITVPGNGILYYLYFVMSSLWFYFRNRRKYHLIYLHDYYSTFPGWILSFFEKKEKLIYDAHELLVNPRKYPVGRRERMFIWFEKHLVKRVRWVISANKERETIIRRLYKLHNTIHVMNISNYKISNKKRIIDSSAIKVVYQGAITESRNLSFFIDAMSNLSNNIELVMIGNGPSLEQYKNDVKKRGLQDRVSFTGKLSNVEMMEKLKECHIGIISYSFEGLNNIYCSPNKIFEYAAINLPFISTNQPFIVEVSKKYYIGRTFEYGSMDSFVNNLNELIKNYNLYTVGTEKFLNDYNSYNEGKKLIDIL